MTGALLAHSAVTHGLSTVVTELLSFPDGNEFYWVPVEGPLIGLSFRDALVHLKEREDCIAIALGSDGSAYQTNPPGSRVLQTGDRVLVVARVAVSMDDEPAPPCRCARRRAQPEAGRTRARVRPMSVTLRLAPPAAEGVQETRRGAARRLLRLQPRPPLGIVLQQHPFVPVGAGTCPERAVQP